MAPSTSPNGSCHHGAHKQSSAETGTCDPKAAAASEQKSSIETTESAHGSVSSSHSENMRPNLFGLDPIVVDAFDNMRDCAFILRIDVQIEKFLQNSDSQRLELEPMSSYHRLILHRIADYYGIDHLSLVKDGQRAIVYQKNAVISRRQPTISDIQKMLKPQSQNLSLHSREYHSSSPARQGLHPTNSLPKRKMKIMRRRSSAEKASLPKDSSVSSDTPADAQKSLQEREQAYAEARAKLFRDLDESKNVDESDGVVAEVQNPTVSDIGANRWDIEPHEEELYDRSRYSRSRGPPQQFTPPHPPYPPQPMYQPQRSPYHHHHYPPVSAQNPYYCPSQMRPYPPQFSESTHSHQAQLHQEVYRPPQQAGQYVPHHWEYGGHAGPTSHFPLAPLPVPSMDNSQFPSLGRPSQHMHPSGAWINHAEAQYGPPRQAPPSHYNHQTDLHGSSQSWEQSVNMHRLSLQESQTSNTLEVYDFPSGIKNYEMVVLLEDLKCYGCSIHWVSRDQVFAVFHSPEAAEHALQTVRHARFKIRRPLMQ